jgi:hypothetical protein
MIKWECKPENQETEIGYRKTGRKFSRFSFFVNMKMSFLIKNKKLKPAEFASLEGSWKTSVNPAFNGKDLVFLRLTSALLACVRAREFRPTIGTLPKLSWWTTIIYWAPKIWISKRPNGCLQPQHSYDILGSKHSFPLSVKIIAF